MAAISLDNPEIAKMSLEKNRLASFNNWPFQDEGRTDICTAEKVIFQTEKPFKNPWNIYFPCCQIVN